MEEEEDSFVELALRLRRNGRTKGQGCQCLADHNVYLGVSNREKKLARF